METSVIFSFHFKFKEKQMSNPLAVDFPVFVQFCLQAPRDILGCTVRM